MSMEKNHLSLKPPKGMERLCGRDSIWAAIRQLKTFDWTDIEHLTGISEHIIKGYLRDLRYKHYIEYIDKGGRYEKARFKLVKDIGIERPVISRYTPEQQKMTGRDQIWRTLKVINQDFNKHQLKVLASTKEHVISIREVKFYLLYLWRSGYLHRVSKGRGNESSVYRPIKSRIVGPRTPRVLTTHQVFDPNQKKIVWSEEFEELK